MSSDISYINKPVEDLKEDSYMSDSDGEMSGVHEELKVFICNTVEDVDTFTLKPLSLERVYTCAVCDKKYTSNSNLTSHLVRHRQNSDLPFSCSTCDFRFSSKLELGRHNLKHQREYFNCPFCSKVFLRKSSVTHHVKTSHVRNFVLECSKCSFQAYKRNIMRHHILKHEGPLFCCPICGSFFEYKNNLHAHLRSHTDDRAYSCKECGKKFLKSNDLSAHVKQVHRPKNFVCSVCKKKFSTTHHLKRHFLTHTNEKPHSCCFCSYASTTQSNLLKHIRAVHEKLSFTYKDVLRVKGKIDDPKEVMPLSKLKSIHVNGYIVAKDEIEKRQTSAPTPATIPELKKKFQEKRTAKVSQLKANHLRKRKASQKKEESDHIENGKPESLTRTDDPAIVATFSQEAPSSVTDEPKIEIKSDNSYQTLSIIPNESYETQHDADDHVLPVLHFNAPEISGQCIMQEIHNSVVPFISECSDSNANLIIIDEVSDVEIKEVQHFYQVDPIDDGPLCLDLTKKENNDQTSKANNNNVVIQTFSSNFCPVEDTTLDTSICEDSLDSLPSTVNISINEGDLLALIDRIGQ